MIDISLFSIAGV